MDRRSGLILVSAVWVSNQIVGYGFLGYLFELQSYAWGAMLCISSMAAFFFARAVAAHSQRLGQMASLAFALIVAFMVYEGALYLASFALPPCEGAFSWPVIGRIGVINATSFAILLASHRVAIVSGAVRYLEIQFRTLQANRAS